MEAQRTTHCESFDAWLDALNDTHHNPVHWSVPINSPITVRWDGRVGYYDRWGMFRATEVAPPGGKSRLATGTGSARVRVRTGSVAGGSSRPVEAV